ncbi:MAG: 30S ribosomal protein S12 methylthiotransferase RimO [Candidatus Omnitrophota bacterium]
MRIGYLSLGCAKNLVDTEIMLGALKEKGHVISDELDGADIAIVNTCAFIKEAKQESIDVILKCARLKEEGKLKYLVVAGCLPQRYKGELVNELKEVDVFLGVPKSLYTHKSPRHAISPAHYAYIKIADGCINRCSYCAVPFIRGPYRSRELESVVKEAQFLTGDCGAKEINLIAQDTTLYGKDIYKKPRLPELLEKLNNIKGKFWIRLLYTHPAHVSGELIAAMKELPKLCRYIDLPLQHINDAILKKMRRHITKKQILALIGTLRDNIPELTIRTSLIVGFPGETKTQFEELLGFMKNIKFERLGAFVYSREENTAAAKFPDQVPEKIKKQRLNEVMALQEEISKEVNSRFLGKKLEVLIEEKAKKSYIGRTEADAPEVDGCVYVESKRKLNPGDFVNARIIDTLEYDLVGEAI